MSCPFIWPFMSKTPSSFPRRNLRPNLFRKVSGAGEARRWLPACCGCATGGLSCRRLLRIRCRALAGRLQPAAADDRHRLAAEIGEADQEHGKQEEQVDGICK